jgi:uncharacterized protein YndB with AHSA1/START domain
MDELQEQQGRSVLRMERRLAHPQEKVWRAITQPEHLVHWFPGAMAMELRPGAPITFTDTSEKGDLTGEDLAGQVLEVDPPRLFAFLWSGEHLRFELRPDGDGTVLLFTHAFDDRPGAGMFAAGWDGCFTLLAGLLDGTPAQEPSWQQAHERYAQRFGLGTAAADGDGGWRLERQLTRPIDEVRPLLADFGDVDWDLTEGPGGAARLILSGQGDPAPWERRVADLAAEVAR